MKHIICILFVLITLRATSQKINATTAAYLKSENYIHLIDTAKLPASVKANYQTVAGYLLKHFKTVNDYYFKAAEVHNNDQFFNITLYALNGILLAKKTATDEITMNKRIKNKTDTLPDGGIITKHIINSVSGNLSGRDGTLKINKHTGEVTFMMWQ
jgi:hypothetical protein